MPKVAITIGPKTYNVQCGEGEQDRLLALGRLVAEQYDRLGNARAPLEAENLLFTALFMADDLAEAKSQAVAAVRMARDARAQLEKAAEERKRLQETSADGKAGLKTEIETLRKAEERARTELAEAKAELAQLREASAHQHDLFGPPIDHEALAEKLEALAETIENTAAVLEPHSPEGDQAAPA